MTNMAEKQTNINNLSDDFNVIANYKTKLRNYLDSYSTLYKGDKINTNNIVYQYLEHDNDIKINQFCERLVNTTYIKCISPYMDEKSNSDLFLATVALFINNLNGLTNVFNNTVKTRDDIKEYSNLMKILSVKQNKSINEFKCNILKNINTLSFFFV